MSDVEDHNPIDEIESTDEMVRVGVREMLLWDPEFDSAESAVERIYFAMEEVRLLVKHPGLLEKKKEYVG